MKNECREVAKANVKSNSFLKSIGRGAYISWEDDDLASTTSDSKNDEIAQFYFMGDKKKQNEVPYSDSDSESNPSYEELQKTLIDMHGKAFPKLSVEKKVIFKLKELSQLKTDFECLKDYHAFVLMKNL